MAFTFEQLFAADPSNPSNIAQNASITIFAPGDPTMAPLTITDPDGTTLPNPFSVNANGFGPAFMHETLDRVAWIGGGFTGFVTSYEGMKQVAVDAQAAAETAASTAGVDAAAVATAAIGTATDEAEAAAASAATAASNASASATAAANSAALVGAPADTAIAAAINGSATATKTALNATYANKWKANTAYAAGDAVLSPSGSMVTAKAAHTSGASFAVGSWNFGTAYTAQDSATRQDAALLRIKASLAKTAAGNAKTNIFMFGHSMNSGYKVTSYKDMLQNTLGVALRRKLALGSDGGAFFSIPKDWVNPSVTDWPLTINTPVLTATGHGIPAGSKGQWLHPTLGSIVVAVPAGVTALGVWTGSDGNQPGGTYTWQIDAGSTTSVNTSSDAQANYGFRRLTVIPLDGLAHNVTLLGTVGYTAVDAVEFFKSDSTNGVHVFSDGNPSFTTTQLVGAPTNNYKIGSGTTASLMQSLNHLNPAAIVFTGLVNDYSSGSAGANPVPSATTATNLVNILEALAGACATRPSIIINVEHQRQNLAMTEPWQNYVDVAYSVAAANGYAVFDGGKRFGTLPTPAVTAGLLDADLIHPSPDGFWDWGYGLAGFMAR